MRRLPPLTAVEAFVQVARLGSLKAAAEDLSLSSPALSRRVQSMERFVGRPLFVRRHQAMELNPDGEMLLTRIAPALDALSIAVDQARGEPEAMRLKLGVLPLYASRRLIPRLPELRALHPSLHIDVDTGAHGLARLNDELDAAIVLAPEIESSVYGRRLSRNRVVAIASRTLAEGERPIRTPADLVGTTILLHRDMPMNFQLWREAIGVPEIEAAAVDHFDSGQLMLESAAAGLGVALMLDLHFESANDPRLVRLFGEDIDTPLGYWFVCRWPALSRRPVKLFHDWLVEAVGEV